MSFFLQYQGSRLYLPATSGDPGWLGYLLPASVTQPPASLELQAALTGQPGSFLFSALVPEFGKDGSLAAFVKAVDALLNAQVTARGLLWIADPSDPGADAPPFLGMDDGGSTVRSGLTAPIVQSSGTVELSVLVNNNTSIALNDTALTLSGPGALTWGGNAAPAAGQINFGTIPLSGGARGCLLFGTYLQRQSLNGNLNWGFQFLYPASAQSARQAISEWLPLASGFLPDAADLLGFDASVDPADPLGLLLDRTDLTFTGQNFDSSQTVLISAYRTPYGAAVALAPVPGPRNVDPTAARLVFHAGAVGDGGTAEFQAAPAGDFVLNVNGADADTAYDLMCGLQGTEHVAFQPTAGQYAGDRLRFVARQPAFAARYPFQAASPVGPAVDPHAPLLEPDYLTSWATLVRAPGSKGAIPYVAQPRGASLYGRDKLIHDGTLSVDGHSDSSGGFPTLFGPMDPSVVLPDTSVFPLAPYADFDPGDGTSGMDADQSQRFEREILGPTRRLQIGGKTTAPSKTAALALRAATAASTDSQYNTTTPTGLLVTVDDGKWTKVLLAQNTPPSPAPARQAPRGLEARSGDSPFRQMAFCQPNDTLQQAMQTGQLFQVVANAANLGQLSGGGSGGCGAAAAFLNRMNVGAWDMSADVGQDNRYDDYSNVLIIKGRTGALYDPASASTRAASLVSNPDQWTQKDAFAAPSDLRIDPATGNEVVGPPDVTELLILSGWLQRYFGAASEATDTEYFSTFNRIARDADWTGILVLRMKIAQLPNDLAGIMAGVSAPERFFAHHLAIQISPVANDPSAKDIELSSPSSIFGLIYYTDPSFTPPLAGQTAQPVAPAAGTDYDFRLLSLKVLFQNTAVQRFQSWAQLTLNRLFGMPVTRMGGGGGNPYNTLVLAGSYQNNSGQPVYSLSTQADSTFFFDNNVVRKIEMQSAAMSTLNPGNQATDPTVISWFGLTGLIDFRVAWQADDPGNGAPKSYYPFDVFSFGSDEPQPPPTPVGDGQIGKGLAFSNLGVTMSFPLGDTTQRKLALVSDQIRFDVTRSTPRAGSLYQNFALQVAGLVTGACDSSPAAAGFLTVIPDAMFTGVDGSEWTGIRYALSLGSPGALAGNVGLTSQLLAGWAPSSSGDGTYRAVLGIQLPGTGGGAKLISLQTVLKLSIGQIRLARDRDNNSFLLMMSEIALRFLGLLKLPPNGSTLFYLFGNPASEGKPSGLGWYAMYKN
jgi:hypothetical protein